MSKKILILDDEPQRTEAVLDRVKHDLGEESVLYAQNYAEAINFLENYEICCMSIDMIIPKDERMLFHDSLVYGLNVLKEIRQKKEALPIACYSIIQEIDVIIQIEKLNAIYLHKKDKMAFYKLIDFFKKHFK